MNVMTSTALAQFERDDPSPEIGPTFKERLADAASDYETLDAENVAGVGI